nr:ATP synthase F0 subunit 6 [Vignadula atrata]
MGWLSFCESSMKSGSKTDPWSSFDSECFSVFTSLPLWLSVFVCLLLVSSSEFSALSRSNVILGKAQLLSWNLVKSTSGLKISGFPLVICSLFVFLLSLNFMGMVPYAFSLTSQLSVALPLALVFCISLVVSSIRGGFWQFYSSLVPSYAPMALVPFLMVVELITVCSRPFTLGFRLLINIISGHLIMGMVMDSCYSLISSLAWGCSFLLFFLSISAWMLLLMAELGVAFLQAYIFCILLSLYSDEHSK